MSHGYQPPPVPPDDKTAISQVAHAIRLLADQMGRICDELHEANQKLEKAFPGSNSDPR